MIEKFTTAPKKGLKLEFFLPKHLDSISLRQICVGKLNFGRENKIQYVFGNKNHSVITANTKSGGKYFLTKDTKSPWVKPINFKNGAWVKSLSKLKIRIGDNLSGIKKYTAYINGEWILMEYEPKRKLLFFDFNDLEFNDTKLKFKLILEDIVGNVKDFEATVYR